MAIEYFMWYNDATMKKLYYATFEKNFDEVVKTIIKKQDKNALIKKLYADSVLFFADEKFSFENSCFKAAYLVIDNMQKLGAGALNAEMKHLLEKKYLKIFFPREVSNFKLTFSKENSNVVIDANLKNAVEIMLKKATKKTISYLSTQAELVFLAKADGTNLFMKKLSKSSELAKLENRYEIAPDVAYMINFLSEPAGAEVVLDPYAQKGILSYVRAYCFKKANIIANDADKENVAALKKRAKTLKDKSFSVLNYDFLSDSFPIKFIDKVVTDITDLQYQKSFRANEFFTEFFEKLYTLKIKVAVIVTSKSHDITRFITGKFDVEREVIATKYNVYKLKIRG